MLNLILGKSGYGKTEYIRKLAVDMVKNGEKVMIILPDQASFSEESYMLRTYGEEISAKMDIFHFGRLAEDVFRLYGGITEKRIDDSTKNLIMSLAVSAVYDRLNLYKKANKNDLTNLMISIIDELKNFGVTADDIFEVREKTEDVLNEKLSEIGLVYQSFEALLNNVYIEPNDLQKRASEVLQNRNYFADKIILIDAFEGFDSAKINIIRNAIRTAKEVYITLCTDDIYNENDSIFSPINETGRKLITLAREEGQQVKKFIRLNEAKRFVSGDIKYLENNIYSKGKNEKIKAENIEIFETKDIYSEADLIASRIKKLTREGYKYNDITVICRNSAQYNDLLENTFKKWDIPAFISAPNKIDNSPIIRLVVTAFKIINYGYRSEDIISLAKTGLIFTEENSIFELENYVYLWNINYNDWKKSFTKSPYGFDKVKEVSEKLEILEKLRKIIIEPLEKFKKDCDKKTGKDISKAVYDLVYKYGAGISVLRNYEALEESGLFEKANEQIAVWDKLMSLLDKFAVVLENQAIDSKSYAELFASVLAKEDVLDIPLRLDTVMFGSANSIKHSSKVVFMIGLIQGEFPLIPENNKAFTSLELETLKEQKLNFGTNIESDILLEQFYTYMASSSASEKLIVTYPLSKSDTSFVRSDFVNRVCDLFEIDIQNKLATKDFISTKEILFSKFAETFRDNTDESKTIRTLTEAVGGFHEKINTLDRLKENKPFEISNKTASELFNINRISPSQIELFHSCKFWYFCRYGLRVEERKTAKIDPLQYGNLMHYIFEEVLGNNSYLELNDEELETKIEEISDKYIEEELGGMDILSDADKYRFIRMNKTAVIVSARLLREVVQSKFKPVGLELKLEDNGKVPMLKIPLENGEIKVGGLIDRVDMYTENQTDYVRVIDYKTGNKIFKLSDALDGINLQMLIYLLALKEVGLTPTAVLYMPSSFPNVSIGRNDSRADAKKKQQDKMKMNGLIVENKIVVKAMEPSGSGEFLPVKFKTNGDFASTDSLVKDTELDRIFDYIKELIKNMGKDLMDGKITAEYLVKNKDKCSYCPYSAVCSVEKGEKEEVKLKTGETVKLIENELNKKKGVATR